MKLQTVYDADGKAHNIEPVDAREYIASGAYFHESPTEPVKKPRASKKDAAIEPAKTESEAQPE